MRYTIIPLRDVQHVYVAIEAEITHTDAIDEARAAVRAGFERHGIVPDVLHQGRKVWLYSNEEVARWALKRYVPHPGAQARMFERVITPQAIDAPVACIDDGSDLA